MTSAWLTWPRPPLAATPREPVVAKAATQRISFSGPQARSLWQPRLERLRHVALAIEFEKVRQGRIPATLVWTDYDGVDALTEQARAIGLDAKPVKASLGYAADWPPEASIDEPKRLLDYAFLIGARPLDASIAEPAADGLAQAAMRFGYPACCARSWANDLRHGGSDPLASLLARDDKGGDASPRRARGSGTGAAAARAVFGGLSRLAGRLARVPRSRPRTRICRRDGVARGDR
ncbi:hypothetical protein ACVIW2_003276 [Bradyrhizobium huanghuaihaiense]